MKIAALVAALAAACACLPFTACGSNKLPYDKIGGESDFLRTEGELVKNGAGETVYLRGVNAGGLFVTEHWMTGFLSVSGVSSDYRSLTATFINRFGEKDTKKLWAEYRANWWTDFDFKTCADLGMNVIRLPFTYMNVDFGAVTDYKNAGNYDFSDLDAFVSRAAEYGMYTILDLHGAYGSQNGKDHSGERIDNGTVDFYSNDEMKRLTANLWGALAEHYKNNAAVAGYDILNEPGEHAGPTGKTHWDFYDQVYDAIRAKDEKHIVIFESCWTGENLPRPSDYGWQNCMYSFHHYTSNTDKTDKGILSHNSSWNEVIANVTARNFGVPIQMGEFCSYTSPEKWEYTLGLLNRSNWHWVSWTYKVWSNQKNDSEEVVTSPWGIVNVIGNNSEKVNPLEDSYETILQKFKKLRTEGDSVKNYTFYTKDEFGETAVYKTLGDIYAENLADKSHVEKLAEGSYRLYTADDRSPLTLSGSIGGIISPKIGEAGGEAVACTLKYYSSKDGTAYILAEGKTLTVMEYNKVNYITANGSATDGARFYPVNTEGGVVLISYITCKYLKIDTNGLLRADADRSSASVFTAENVPAID